MRKTKTIVIISVTSILLVLGIAGATYAWFVTTVVGSGNDVVITTANLGTITYTDGTAISKENFVPGDKLTKTFTIVSSSNTTVDNQEYEITLNVISNTLSSASEGAFVYTLSGVTTTNGGTTANVTESVVPQTTSRLGLGTINKGATHTYTFTLELKETGLNQNATQGKVFNAKIEVQAFISPFNKGTLANQIYKDNAGGKSDTSVNFAANPITDLGLYYTDESNLSYTEGGKVSYYYRGAVQNNFVKFGKNSSNQDLYWRIIRIDEDNNIRLIYNGTTTAQTGTTTQIGTSAFNSSHNQNAYVGYMYGTPGSTTYEAEHANTNNSDIKTTIDNWFAANMTEERSYLSEDAVYCNDRSLSSGTGIGTVSTIYGADPRVVITNRPDFRCSQINDRFTTSTATKGNKKLTYPVGLITIDEVMFAGSNRSVSSSNFYLNTGQDQWTLSPRYFDGDYQNANLFRLSSYGYIGINFHYVSYAYGVRPTVSLKSNSEVLKGNGTPEQPYELK